MINHLFCLKPKNHLTAMMSSTAALTGRTVNFVVSGNMIARMIVSKAGQKVEIISKKPCLSEGAFFATEESRTFGSRDPSLSLRETFLRWPVINIAPGLIFTGKIIDTATKMSIPIENIIIDPLVMTVGHNSYAALLTIKTVELIKKEYVVNMSLGERIEITGKQNSLLQDCF